MTDRVWYFAVGGNRQGPISEDELRAKIASGEIRADTLVWNSGMTDWTRAGAVPGLMGPGAPAMPPGAPALPSAPYTGGHDGAAFTPHFGTWPLLGRSLLVFIGDLLIIPAPWVNTGFYRWLVDNIEPPNGKRVHFEGQVGDIWWVFVLNAIFMYLGQVHGAVLIVTLLLSVFFYYMIARWFFANLAWEGQTERLRFVGSFWGMVGWMVLTWLGFLVIIGWAWAQTAMMRWICANVEGSSKQLSFVGTGWEVLWRTFVFVISALFIIPIPWTMRWLMAWYVTQFRLSERV
jgi:hypothetical protein